MKKRSVVSLLLAVSILFISCSRTEKLDERQSAAPIVRGGTMKVVASLSPQVLGYPPEMGPQDKTFTYPALETLMSFTEKRALKPFLCSKVDIDPAAPSITFFLRKRILFHDGSELTADVARWMFQLLIDTRNLQYGENIKSIDLLDNYTFRLNLAKYNNQMIYSYGLVNMVSKNAIVKNGKDWAKVNCVGTGPFRLVEFKRDEHVNWARFDGYWRKDAGLPYLDAIEVRFIPDPVTAASIMEAGQADLWMAPGAQYQKKLVDRGLRRQIGYAGLSMWMMPNYLRSDGKWKNKQLREALEYAIDKAAITKAFGYGYTIPLNLISPPGEWGYDPKLSREYNPDRARALIAQAGFRTPVKVKILVDNNGRNTGSAIKGYLDAAGFQCELDVADSGRYFNSAYTSGWEDLLFAASGIDPNYLITISDWFSPQSRVKMPSWVRPPLFSDLWQQALLKNSDKEQEDLTAQMVKYLYDEALICPVYLLPNAGVMQSYVHTNYLLQGLLMWNIGEDWIDKR